MAASFIKKYIDNISGLQIFQLMRYCTLLLISIVFTKSGLSTGEIGSYEIFLFITALLCTFWVSGIIQSFLPLYRKNSIFKGKKGKSPEIFNAFILISLLSLLAVLTLIGFKGLFEQAFTQSSEIPFFELILVYILFSCPAFLNEYIYLLKNRPGRIMRYGLISFSFQLVIVSGPAILDMGMYYSVLGLAASAVFRYLWLIVLLKKYARIELSLPFIKEHLHYAYPLIFSVLMGASAQYIDGFLVLNTFDPSTFAIFKYGAREFPLVLLMANALSNALIPEFAKETGFNEALVQLKRKSANLMHLLFPVSIVFLLGSEWIYPRIFNENFAESAHIFNIYLLLIISRLVFPHSILIGLKKNKIVMYASLAEFILNVVLSVIFLRFWGIEGVAFATVIAYAFQKIVWIAYNRMSLQIPLKKYVSVPVLAGYSIVLLSTFVIIYFS